jgi:ankyrin repeat protein
MLAMALRYSGQLLGSLLLAVSLGSSWIWSGLAQAEDCLETRSDDLLSAVWGQDTARVRDLIAQGSPVDMTDRDGTTPLQAAAILGNLEIVELLVAEGADIDQANACGSALVRALDRGHREVALYLLQSGATVDNQRQSTLTTLDRAIEAGDVDLIRWLARQGADIEQIETQLRDARFDWPLPSKPHHKLHLCPNQCLISDAVEQQEPILWALLEEGFLTESSLIYSLMDAVFERDDLTALDQLIAHNVVIDLNRPAAKLTDLEWVRDLLEAGAKPPLRRAIQENLPEVVDLALEYGADPTVALYTTFRSGHRHIMAQLLEAGADPGRTLTLAAGLGDLDLAQLALSRGADINYALFNSSPDCFFHEGILPPLHYAARNGDADMVRLLLEAGADIHLTHQHVFDLFQEGSKVKIADVLALPRFAEMPPAQAFKSAYIHHDFLGMATYCYEETALDQAIRGNHEDVIRILEAEGASSTLADSPF